MNFSLRIIAVLILFIFFGCRAKQEVLLQNQPVEVKVPNWVSSRPNNGFKYTGVGFAEKGKGTGYQMEAKKNALYDLSSEIKVDISSNSVLYTVQNNNTFNENFNSLIKLSNTDNIEGYTLVDSYENEKQYWVYYQLDKQAYAEQKALKKQQTINKAMGLISASYSDEANKDFSNSLKKRIQAFGVLTPYLSEEINFDPAQAHGLKTVFDLTTLIQQQLQTISVVQQSVTPVLKPYQASYQPITYQLELRNKVPLQNFPLTVTSDDEKINVDDKTITNAAGAVQLKVNSVEPINQNVGFSLNPDISALMGSDSVGRAGVNILKQFIQTGTLKVFANVNDVTIFINSAEKNFGKPTGLTLIESFVKQKFSGQEVQLVDKPAEADYIIDVTADTQEDLSSSVLQANYSVRLASLVIQLSLKNRITNETLYKTQLNEIYGYANLLEKAGLNAYSNPRLEAKLAEGVFFLKRKILVY